MTPLLFAFATTTPTAADVLAMMRLVPAECALTGQCADVPAGFDRTRDAPAISEAIAAGVIDEPDPWGRAALGVVYACFESGAQACPTAGDGGPPRAFSAWLAIARRSEATCAANTHGEELAALASGSCFKARRKVRLRALLAARIVWGVPS
jgi:hypothetical protein